MKIGLSGATWELGPRALRARWLFASACLGIGLAGGGRPCLTTALVVAGYNLLLLGVARRRHPAAASILVQLLVDSLATAVAIHYGRTLTPAAQLLFLFPLCQAALLWPGEGLFLTAGACGVAYALGDWAGVMGWWPPNPAFDPADPAISSLAAVALVLGALLAAAAGLNRLVIALAGTEQRLDASQRDYKRLAEGLEVQVRERTEDLWHTNDQLVARHRQMTRLQEVDAAIHSSENMSTVLQRVCDGVSEFLPETLCATLLVGDDGHLALARASRSAERHLAAVESILGRPLSECRLALTPGTPAAYAVRSREPVITHDVARLTAAHVGSPLTQALLPDITRVLALASAVVLPLAADGECLGLLVVGSRRTLSRDDTEPVRAFATQAAIALSRVRRAEALRDQQTALRSAYEELARSQEAAIATERMRAVGEMTSGIAHNFNNALTTIMGVTQLVMQRPELPPDIHDKLKRVEGAAEDAAVMVKRLRGFIKAGLDAVAQADFNDLVDDVVGFTDTVWCHGPLRADAPIDLNFEPGATQSVLVEATAIREVITNLILNAVKAMPDGGRLDLRTWDDGPRVALSVRDTGVGMAPEVRRRCFEPFYTTGGEEGTGLGLSLAQSVIQRHGGQIHVDSTLGVGTTFTLWLPATESQQSVGASEPGDGWTPTAVGDDTAGLRPLHVLLVDDHAGVRQTLGNLLQATGHAVTLANNGDQALAMFDPRRHDVVITDWAMPGMSGLQLARGLKQASPGTPVLLVTGYDSPLPPEALASADIDLRLQKPISTADLARALSLVTQPPEAAVG